MSRAHELAQTVRGELHRHDAQHGPFFPDVYTPLSELERLADDGDEAGSALRQAATNLATIRPIDSQFRELAFSDEDVSIGEAAQNWERLLRQQGRAALESVEASA